MKECWKCKQMLQLVCFGRNGKSYICKPCEAARVRLHYDNVRKAREMEAVNDVVVTCHACMKPVRFSRLSKTGILKNKVCKPCKMKYDHHKRPHVAKMEQGECVICVTYGQSDCCSMPY